MLRDLAKMWVHARDLTIITQQLQAESGREKEIEDNFHRFEKQLEGLGLLGETPIWDLQLFFSVIRFNRITVQGTDISEIYQLSPSPKVGVLRQKALEWQILHPSGTKEECRRHLDEEFERG